MVFPPSSPPASPSSLTGAILGTSSTNANGFSADFVPGTSGFGVREVLLQPYRPAVNARNIMHWLVPEGPIIQMYINPQNVTYTFKKNITPTRTKGGYTVQYWGEELGNLSISGTTGTSGYEGINVLYDLYRNEQLQFDPFALFLQAQFSAETLTAGLFGGDALSAGATIGSSLLGAAESLIPGAVQQPPTLASMALTVELYWSGEVYRGYFTEFVVKESADQLGLFNYDMNFTVTQKRGFRQNFLGWHRSPVYGPSNSDPVVGRPYSFGSLVAGEQPTPGLLPPEDLGSALSSALDPFDLF
ncbi:MAG TPA: hypothetical protein VM577_08570 [Anaerovoracaceae bacterium]|nr:hypothetical protein [Anaerovoracaceae bacterium]